MGSLREVGNLLYLVDRPDRDTALRKGFAQHLPPLIALMAQTNTEMAESLTLLQRESQLFESLSAESMDEGIAMDLNTLTYADSVLEVPLVVTKVALYIYLNAMVHLNLKTVWAYLTSPALWAAYRRRHGAVYVSQCPL